MLLLRGKYVALPLANRMEMKTHFRNHVVNFCSKQTVHIEKHN